MIRTSAMWVLKYLPAKLYGFATEASGLEVFFHLGVFHPGDHSTIPVQCQACKPAPCFEALPPPPILGEAVLVTYETDTADGKAPRATRVERQSPATVLVGHVESMDPARGYGFLQGHDGVSYHLHRSEVVDGHIPLPEQMVIFYAGLRQDKPRACHVRVCRWRTPTTKTPTSSAGSRSMGSTSR